MSENINILLVEDNPGDAALVKEYLKEIYNQSFNLTTCDYVEKALALLNKEKVGLLNKNIFDLILLDLSLPDSSGLDTFNTIFKKDPECPIIILTGLDDEATGIKAVKLGAQDFLVKNNVTANSLKHTITHSLERYKLLKALADNTEILEKKTADLSRKQQQFEEAQKLAHMGSWEWDTITNTISWSDELFRIFGLEPQKFTPTSGSSIKYLHPDDKERVTKITGSAYHDKTPFSINYRIIQPGGTERTVHEEAKAITDADGKIVKMYGILMDSTEQKRLEEVTKEKEVAQKLALTKDQFLSRMSHEIRTPLSGIIGFTKLMLRNGISEKQKSQLQAIKSSSDILLVLINDILDIAKIDAGKIHIEETELKLEELINTIITSFEFQFEDKQLKVNKKYDDRVPKILMGDPVRIEQILLNLLSNAFKFTDKGGQIGLQINLLTEDEGKATIEFIISDTGIGIPAEKQEVIFEPFVQAGSDTTRKYGGTGLGLSIVKRLVKLMNGTISLKSKVKEGSTFTFTLPLRKTTATEVSTETKAYLRSNELKEIGKLKVLLAEDSEINTFLVQTILQHFGFEVDAAKDGKSAIDLLEKNQYDIILMDIIMPEQDGFETTKQIRKKMPDQKSKIPIIALTADVSNEVVVKCKEAGMNDYVSKPFNEIELLNKIARLVKKSREGKSQPIPDSVEKSKV